jgi:hypothetical protein
MTDGFLGNCLPRFRPRPAPPGGYRDAFLHANRVRLAVGQHLPGAPELLLEQRPYFFDERIPGWRAIESTAIPAKLSAWCNRR